MKKKELLLASSAWLPRPNRHYTFEPNTVNGNVLTDLSWVQNGLLVGGPTFDVGRSGSCIQFSEGKNSYVDVGDVNFMRRTGIFSISFWARTTKANENALMTIFGNAIGRDAEGVFVGFDSRVAVSRSRALVLFLSDASGFGAPAVIDFFINGAIPNDRDFHHYVVTLRDNILSVYIDGKKIDSRATNRPFASNFPKMNSLFLGGSNRNGALMNKFIGDVDEFRMLPVELTQNQINRLYQTGQ
jgi:hypothetical protein